MNERRAEAGYTLVELMVAVIITSIVVSALYSVSRSATETFNQQQRTAEMQLRLRFAMEQLRADLSRAGYMATPNSALDPRVCPRPSTNYQGIEITSDVAAPIPLSSDNQYIAPKLVRMMGNFASVDEYVVAGISGSTISLQNQTPQWARVTSGTQFERIFMGATGGRRLLRIVSPTGQMQFVQVVGGMYQASSSAALPQLIVSPPPTLVGDGATSTGIGAACGITGLGVGATVSPVSMIEYRIGNLATTLPQLYPADATQAALKTDLIRSEYNLLPGPTLMVGSERVIGEYAVDLDVGMSIDVGNPVGSLTGMPSLQVVPFGDTRITSLAGNVTTVGVGSAHPERVRSLIVRLSIRDREQDPGFGWVSRASTDPLTRFRVFADREGAARVRTLTTEVVLPNLAVRNLR